MRWSRNFIIATLLVTAGFALVAFILSIIAFVSTTDGAQLIQANGVLSLGAPYAKYLAAQGGPLAMTWPIDLTPYVSRQFRFFSLSTQAHTIQIPVGTAQYVGGTTLATFGGAVGDGFVAEIISPTRIVVISVNNVVFS